MNESEYRMISERWSGYRNVTGRLETNRARYLDV